MVHNVHPFASSAILFRDSVKLTFLKSYGAALQQSSLALNEIVFEMSDLEDVLPDILVWWTGKSHFEPNANLG